jgi:Rieske Fe-S protein
VSADAEAGSSRRGFLKAATAALGAVVGAALAVPALRALLFPVGRRIVAAADGPIDVAAADAVPAGGPPLRVPIVAASARDAWGRGEAVVVGAAYLSRAADGSIAALSAACPHLGCAIAYEASDDTFRCPCHKSAFRRGGDKIEGPSKRGLDPLPVEIEGGRVKLRFVRYKPDVPEREPA